MKRPRLVLARETLSRLSPDDLADVNGGSLSHYGCVTGYTGFTVCGLCVKPATVLSCLTCPCS